MVVDFFNQIGVNLYYLPLIGIAAGWVAIAIFLIIGSRK